MSEADFDDEIKHLTTCIIALDVMGKTPMRGKQMRTLGKKTNVNSQIEFGKHEKEQIDGLVQREKKVN